MHPQGRVYILKFTLGRSDGLLLWGCAAKSLSWTFEPVSDQRRTGQIDLLENETYVSSRNLN